MVMPLQDLMGGKALPQDVKYQTRLPRVRVPVRLKITLPYIILALALALAAAFVVSQVVLDTIEERFTNQLIEAGKLSSDWMVTEEDRLLETLRLLSHTLGFSDSVAAGDAERLRHMALPVAVNYQEEAIEILDSQGLSLLSLRHITGGNLEDYSATRGEDIFYQWNFVRNVLEQRVEQNRDKYAGLARAPWGDYLYVSGPILDEQGNRVGVILIGKSLSTLARQIRQDTLAHITFYDLNGRPIASTLPLIEDVGQVNSEFVSTVLERQDEASLTRPLVSASINYTEIIGPWEARAFTGTSQISGHPDMARHPDMAGQNNDLGLIGVALAEMFLARPSQITRIQIFLLTAVAFILVIGLGIYIAGQITRPLLRIVMASAQVAEGNLEIQVEAKGDDEVAVLAHSFNQMVSGLREGSIYRDLFGRTVSPEVREQLRQSFAAGDLNLAGQETVATVLVSDIRGFTTLAEAESPTTILNWLNEYFGELVPIIITYEGIISKFDGDTIMAFFGILPRPISAQESAYQACQAALAMVRAIECLNERRAMRGAPPLLSGIGVNTGPVTAGSLGTPDRLHYTIIGDTVNATAHLESLTRQFGNRVSAVISQHTLFALRERRHEFNLEAMGAHNIRGKEEQLIVYRLTPAKTPT
jgi:adenylate cyclase